MRNVLIGLGIVFLILVAGGVAFHLYEAQSGSRFDASSKAFVDESVPAILSTWSKDELTKRACPQLQEKISDKVDAMFSRLNAGLGAFQSYDGATGQAFPRFSLRRAKMTATASYVAGATFRNGKIDMKLVLLWDGENWQIAGFEIKPKSS